MCAGQTAAACRADPVERIRLLQAGPISCAFFLLWACRCIFRGAEDPAREAGEGDEGVAVKVLIVNRYMSLYGGAETVVKELAENLMRRGVETRVLALNISDEVARLCEGIPMSTPRRNFPYAYRSRSLVSSFGILAEAFALRALVRRYADAFDVINVHNFPAHWVVHGLKSARVWLCNEPPDFYNNPCVSPAIRLVRKWGMVVDRWLVRKNIDTICVADSLNAARVRERYGRESTIIPYGIDVDIFTPASHASPVSLDRQEAAQNAAQDGDCAQGRELVLLQVGVISPEKNQSASVQALHRLCDAGHRARLRLVGPITDPAYAGRLKADIRARGLEPLVEFVGQKSKHELVEYYREADLCLFPVRTQGGWLAPFEALSCEKPVMVSTTMGASALIGEHAFGFVSEDFASDILEVVAQRASWEARARRACTWTRQNLTWQRYADQMLAVFERTLEETNRR